MSKTFYNTPGIFTYTPNTYNLQSRVVSFSDEKKLLKQVDSG